MKRAIAGSLLTGLVLAAGVVPARSQPAENLAKPAPAFTEELLFKAGTDGYSCFRIPAIVRAKDGALLAFAEGRVKDCGDDGNIDLVLKRSADGGRTWGPVQVVARGDGDTRGNPSPIVDERTGRVVLLTTFNPGDNDHDRRPFVQYSDDSGASWTAPRELSAQISRPEWNRWYATGPMHGIQLRRGPHAGRLVVGVNHETVDGTRGIYGAALVYSDDGGTTWQIGADVESDDNTVKPQEMSVVELTDGRLYVAARDQNGTDHGHRAFATSGDGGQSYQAPFATIPELTAPIIQASTLRLHARDQGDRTNRILFSSPAHPASREAMTVRSSTDEGRSWESWQRGKVISYDFAAYSDLVQLGDSEIGLLYEAGTRSAYEAIRWARFNESYLDSPNPPAPGTGPAPAPGPVTPDESGRRNTAYVRGGAQLGEGRYGKAMTLDGVDDQVRLPFTRSLDLGADDFTLTAWVRYGERTGSQVLLWGYRIGEGPTPGIWLRAEPESNRIRGFLGTDGGTATVSSTGAYNDQQWHHVALRRAGDLFSLYIDGAHVASTTAQTGSATTGKEFRIDGFSVGARLDGAQPLRGAVDEVRVYRRALSAPELAVVHNANATPAGNLELRLPMERIGPR
ncbi:sialidase family protein [Amycolatopsis nigrescens]|uniref:sialidase family protein n=1 Tax=Amycolatopsis nigrescens TaxID=381445 RepID=UPI000367B020|nr:sialidase family protein [Amycolatopsis nigrescens]